MSKKSNFSYTKYLIHGTLSVMEERARELMESFSAWETEDDLDKYIYYRGQYEALREALRALLKEWG